MPGLRHVWQPALLYISRHKANEVRLHCKDDEPLHAPVGTMWGLVQSAPTDQAKVTLASRAGCASDEVR